MIKVLEAISDGNIGGAGVLLCSRLKNSDRSKIETIVLVPEGSKLIKRLKNIGIRVIGVDCRANRSFDIVSVFKLVKIIKNIRPDIVNAHGWLSFRIAAAICGVKIRLYTRHCTFPLKRFFKFKLTKAAFGFFTKVLSHHVIAVAGVVRDNLIDMGVDRREISVIINGCEALKHASGGEIRALRSYYGIADDVRVIGINARLERYKGHECLLKAISLLKGRIPLVCFVIGDGSIRRELENKCEELGIASNVIFVGFVEDVSPYINALEININCSIGTETSSLALSEGMSLGKPAIASDFGGNPYMVKDMVNGLIFPQNHSWALAEKIFLLLNDKELYSKMSQKATERFKTELNAKTMTEKIEALYEKLYLIKHS